MGTALSAAALTLIEEVVSVWRDGDPSDSESSASALDALVVGLALTLARFRCFVKRRRDACSCSSCASSSYRGTTRRRSLITQTRRVVQQHRQDEVQFRSLSYRRHDVHNLLAELRNHAHPADPQSSVDVEAVVLVPNELVDHVVLPTAVQFVEVITRYHYVLGSSELKNSLHSTKSLRYLFVRSNFCTTSL